MKVKFEKIEGAISAVTSEIKYNLLSLFLEDYKENVIMDPIIEDLESLMSREKVFDDIQDSSAYWSYGNGQGYFEVEGDTAYFEPFEERTSAPRIVIPLKEVIDLLKEWRVFLNS
ncbi:hypothetical protein [uncultured Aquimarina sp.]|uniref:hypothetical protein n=1 Tax=uncultured Aquimarina sp. TaxID=575652 RepID=UPI00260DA7DC|nr:hypothetical protein [uncultured Aquimarina sp.]